MQLSHLGPYRVVRRVGRGGMGTVYEAVLEETGQKVAIKVLATALAYDEDSRRRFAAEIESLRRLDHPNIVRLLGYGEHGEHSYYVMELVEGTNLEHELQAGREFTWREATQIGIQLCRALRHAHDRGVIHRDIKPANLLVASTGEVKLSDFGIARLFGLSGLTNQGSIVGTAEYMAPEQADGRAISPQTDLYSLGSVLFTLMAGRTPFRSSSLPKMLQMQRFDAAPPLSKYAPHVPEQLERIIAQLLEKDPQRRIANASVLGRQLEALQEAMSDFGTDEAEENVGGGMYDDPPTRIGETNVADNPDFESSSDPLSPTRVTETKPALSGSSAARRRLAAENNARVAAEREAANRPAAPTRVNLHVAVEKPSMPSEQPAPSSRWRQVSQIAIPAGALLVLIAVVWYMALPLSADRLFAKIEAVDAENREFGMLDAEENLREFLERFPEDPRTAKAQDYMDEIELDHFERRTRFLLARPGGEKNLSSIEAKLLSALRVAPENPKQAQSILQSIVAIYGNAKGNETTQQSVALARRQIIALEDRIKEWTDEQLTVLDQQLDQADAVSRTDHDAARKTWNAIVSLYRDQPWAAARVKRAQDGLEGKSQKAD